MQLGFRHEGRRASQTIVSSAGGAVSQARQSARIRRLRQARGMSQPEPPPAMQALGALTDRRDISRYEGELYEPKLCALSGLARIVGVSARQHDVKRRLPDRRRPHQCALRHVRATPMLASGFKVESDITPYALIANRHPIEDRAGPRDREWRQVGELTASHESDGAAPRTSTSGVGRRRRARVH
jgi:transcriptional regulator with XRE-family HTH domain